MEPPRLKTESRRLRTLKNYQILGTPAEERYDRITRMAAELIGTSYAFVSFVGEDRLWNKSCHGVELREVDRDVALCAHTILADEPLVVEDARRDERFAASPLVVGEPGIRFYAGVPLRAEGGINLGVLSVADPEPRGLDDRQRGLLVDLAAIVVDELELRMSTLELEKSEAALREEGSRLRTILEHVPVVLFAFDREGVFTLSEGRALAALGLRPGEVVGRSVFDVYPDDAAIAESVRHALRGAPTSITVEVNAATLTYWLSPVLDASGQVEQIIGVAVDVTERKRAEDELRRKEEHLRLATGAGGVAIWAFDIARGVPEWSDQAMALFGFEPGMPPPENAFRQRIHPEDRDCVWERYLEWTSPGFSGRFEVEHRLLLPDGSVRWVLTRGEKLVEPGGRSTRLVGTVLDVTERKRAEHLQEGQVHLLDMIAAGRPLSEVLQAVTGFVERQSGDLLASVLLLDDDARTLRHAVAPSLPHGYTEAIDGLVPGPAVGSCGTAVHRGEPVVVRDVASSPLWRDYRERALAHDLRACASYPIRLSAGEIAGTFAFYAREPGEPSGRERALIYAATHLAALAIERDGWTRELMKREALFRTLAEHASDVIFRLAPDSTVRYVSPSAANVLGYTPLELIGQCTLDHTHPEDRPALAAVHEEVLRGRSVRHRYRRRRKDGTYIWIEASTSGAILDAGTGEPGEVVVVARDVTEQIAREAELVEAKEQAEQMTCLKSTLLTNMSHEIRTPLTGIIGFSEVLAEEVTGEHRELAEMLSQSGHRLLETLSSVLDLAQLESGGMTLDLGPVDLHRRVREILPPFHPQCRKAGLKLEVRTAADPVVVRGERGALGRILSNLLSNAIKFTEKGSVTVRVDTDGAYGQIHVIDTGIGITPAFLPHLFDEFRQESAGLGRDYEGVGLGLTITRGLVDLMGGEIRVRSERGAGSVFTVRLPLHAPPPDEVDGGPRGPLQRGRRPRVLVAEDNREARFLMERWLGRRYEVDLAREAAETIERLAARRYDLVILDIDLGSHATGEDVLDAMRRLPGRGRVPAIACTAYALPGDEERFQEAGFDAYLRKPFTRDELEAAVHDVLARSGTGSEGAVAPLRNQ